MAQIYTQAEQVVIYLGESSDDSDSAMDWLRQIDDLAFAEAEFGFTDNTARNSEAGNTPEPAMVLPHMGLARGNSFQVCGCILRRKIHILERFQTLRAVQRIREIG
jgi:hypothetical protein